MFISQLGKGFPENLKALLESVDYIKAGAGIQSGNSFLMNDYSWLILSSDDSKKLHTDYGVEMKSCVDLSMLARSVDNQWKGKYTNPLGLARMIAIYDNLALGKGRVTRSNWEAELDQKQQECKCLSYLETSNVLICFEDASNDAHAGFRLYSRLVKMAKSMDNIPDTAYYSYNLVRGMLCLPSGYLWHPQNPNYDPGPPPAPKMFKESNDGKNKRRFDPKTASTSAVAASTTMQLSSSSTPTVIHHQQTRRKHHHSGNGDYRGRGRGAMENRTKRPRVGDAVSLNTTSMYVRKLCSLVRNKL